MAQNGTPQPLKKPNKKRWPIVDARKLAILNGR